MALPLLLIMLLLMLLLVPAVWSDIQSPWHACENCRHFPLLAASHHRAIAACTTWLPAQLWPTQFAVKSADVAFLLGSHSEVEVVEHCCGSTVAAFTKGLVAESTPQSNPHVVPASVFSV